MAQKDRPPNAGKASQVREAERTDRQRTNQELADLAAVLDIPQGRRVLWGLMRLVHELSFDQNALKMAFNEGQRNFGARLWADVVTVRPAFIPQMMEEGIKAEAKKG